MLRVLRVFAEWPRSRGSTAAWAAEVRSGGRDECAGHAAVVVLTIRLTVSAVTIRARLLPRLVGKPLTEAAHFARSVFGVLSGDGTGRGDSAMR